MGRPGTGRAPVGPAQAAVPILLCGTPEQRRAYLPRLCGPQFISAVAALVEPRLDFDPFALTTAAAPDDGQHVLNGYKCFVPLAADANVLLVYAADTQTNSTQAFIVERGASGLVVREREKNMGLRALVTYEVALEIAASRLRTAWALNKGDRRRRRWAVGADTGGGGIQE